MYEDNTYDVVIFDEYYGQRKITWLNNFLQGTHMEIHRRYYNVIKKENLPCIILSNSSVDDTYKNVPEVYRNALKERLLEINLTTFIKITCTELQQ